MADSFLIRIDLDRLQAGDPEADVAAWLRDNGFIEQPDRGPGWYLAEEISLGLLDRREVLEKERFA